MKMTDSINILKPSSCFEIQKIIGISTIHGNCRSYQVQWAPSWISGAHLIGCEDLIELFENEHQNEEANIKIEVNLEQERNDIENGILTGLPSNNEVMIFEQEEQEEQNEKDANPPPDRLAAISNNEVVMEDNNLHNDILPLQEFKTEVQESASSSYQNNIKYQNAVRSSVHPDFHSPKDVEINGKGSLGVYIAEEVVISSNEDVKGGVNSSFYTDDKSSRKDRMKTRNDISIIKVIKGSKGKDFLHKKSKATKAFKCHVCKKAFSNELTLEDHTKLHNRIHQCMICSKTFASREKLQHHKEMHNVCSICETKFSNTEELKVHIETHKTVKADPLECSYCERWFAMKSQVVIHERVHTGERPFKCNICLVGFKKKQDLQRHGKRHNQYKASRMPKGTPCDDLTESMNQCEMKVLAEV